MIIVSCPIKQDFVIETVEGIEKYKYKFEGKEGIKLKFSCDTTDLEDAAQTLKQAIKATEVGAILYFQIAVA